MIETIVTSLAIGTFWFWLIAVITSIIFIASIENDHYATPTITALVLGIVYWKPISAISWQTILLAIGIYALAGVVWSLFKWYRFVKAKSFCLRERYGDTLSQEEMDTLRRTLSVSQNKARLTGWIAWWPWSLIWNITGDFFNFLYDTMVHAYQKIADHALGKFNVKPAEEVPSKKQMIYGSKTNWDRDNQ